jgi:hypothetical protein
MSKQERGLDESGLPAALGAHWKEPDTRGSRSLRA